MPTTTQPRQKIPLQRANHERLLTGPIERCGHCGLLWPQDDMRDELQEDGLTRRCPNASSPSTDIEYTTRIRQAVAERTEDFIARPNISLMPMETPLPPTVTGVSDASGNLVGQDVPYHAFRNTAGSLTLSGINFPLDDAEALALVSFPVGLATGIGAVSNSTGTSVALTFTIAPFATRDQYSITYNGTALKGVLLVR